MNLETAVAAGERGSTKVYSWDFSKVKWVNFSPIYKYSFIKIVQRKTHSGNEFAVVIEPDETDDKLRFCLPTDVQVSRVDDMIGIQFAVPDPQDPAGGKLIAIEFENKDLETQFTMTAGRRINGFISISPPRVKRSNIGALNKWMKKGSIDLTVTRVNMLGVPESGKTCAQLLLLDEDAPTEGITDSTAIASPTVRAVRVAVDDENIKWERITRDMLMEGLAADLNKAASQEKTEESGIDAASSRSTDHSPVSSVSKDSVSSNQIEDDDIDFHAEEVVQKILEKDLTDIRLKGHWLYVIDSGGQPAYQELLPLFTRAASLNIITLDLSKPLDDKLDMMYRADGKYFRCRSKSTQLASFKSAVSTAAIFKPLYSGIPEEHHHSMHLVLGTHYDKVDDTDLRKCEDTLKSSISSLQPYLNDRIIKRSDNSIIFPVNTVAESKEERDKYRKEVCNAIWISGSDASVTIKIPIRWFAFELSLPDNKSIISFKDAAAIGIKYSMNKEDTKEALRYFHDVSLMLYYPEVINVVFLDPKPILDILSHLLALTFVDDENACNNKNALNILALLKSILVEHKQVSKTDRNNLKDGFFNEKIFNILKSSEVFSQSDFKLPDDLISLLLHLNIITKVDGNEKGSYFIPYALPSYHVSDSDSLPKVEVSDVQPLLIIWREKKKCLPVPQGLFPLVVMHLLNQEELKVDLPSSFRSDFYFKFRDAMSIEITIKDITHSLHLINHCTHIEIAFAQFSGPQEHCSKIREVVMKAVDKVTDDLHMEHNHVNAFACSKDPEKKCYCLIVNKDEFKVKCTDCPGLPRITESKCRCWFKCSTDAPLNTSQQLDVEIVTHPTDTTCHFDESFELSCTAKSRSGRNITFQWLSGGKEIKEDAISTSEGKSVLKMPSNEEHCVINIQCRVSSNGTDWVTSKKAEVKIQFVWFVEQPSYCHGYTGQEGTLECKATGKEPIEYLWLKNENGKMKRISEKPGICVKKDRGLLFFESLAAEHWGSYICQAQNIHEFVSSQTVQVSCEPFRKKVYISVQPSSYVCLIESSVTLHCEAVSPQPVTYQWYLNKKIIANENQNKLNLSSIDKSHFGTYYCIVKSGEDTIESESAVISEGFPFPDTRSFEKIKADQNEAEHQFQTADKTLYAREKVALLIGNEKYSAVRQLKSPHSDVDELSKTLTSFNFKVFSFTNLKFKEIMQVLDVFVRLLDSGVYCLFYYSGHGFRHKNVDYIMPIDIASDLKCDDCIPVTQISYRLQQTKCKVIMILDCCRENFNETNVTPPGNSSANNVCPFNNIDTIWSCSESQPAYERESENCSVFNCALRQALTKRKTIEEFSGEINNYMEEHAHAKSGKVFQRPSTLIQFSPLQLTLHENIMFDWKTSSTTMRIREWHKRIHSIAPVTIGAEDLPGIQSGEVKFEFIRTNVLRVIVKLFKRHNFRSDATYNVSLTESCQKKLDLENVATDELTKTYLKIVLVITSWQNLKEIPKEIISISSGELSSYCPVIEAETYWSFSSN